MSALLLAASVAAAAALVSAAPVEHGHGHKFTCPANWESRSYNAYPDPADAYAYYVCGHQGAVHYNCPAGTIFSTDLHYCDWDVAPTDRPQPTHEPIAPCKQCPADWEKRPYNAYAVEEDCAKYCVCGHQGPVVYTCPKGTLFSSKMHYCDWESNVKCHHDAY